MTTKTYASEQICNSDVIIAFGRGRSGEAGRVVSGLLKAAAKAGKIVRVESYGRMTSCVVYEMTEQQAEEIRAQAISRA